MRESTRHMVQTALLLAFILFFGMTPYGLIPLGFINVTILCIPVVVGTLLIGLRTGLLLGACFGLMSALSAFGLSTTPPSALASALVAANPVLAAIMCFLPRLLVPVATHLTYRLIARKQAYCVRALPFAAVLGSLTNTIFYLGLMLAFYKVSGLDAAAIVTIITGTGLIAGSSEAVVCAVVTGPLVYAIWKATRKK